MPLILTATDFSEVADNAVNYACQLAATCNASVIVVHSFIQPIMFSDMPMPGSIVADEQQDAELQMSTLVQKLEDDYPDLRIKGKVIYGDTLDVFEEYKDNDQAPLMVVLGNSSLHESSSWSESVLISSFRTLQYPVLAVPPGAKFKAANKICFAADSKPGGYDMAVKQLKNIAGVLKSEIHILHIVASDQHNDHSDSEINLENLFADLHPVYHQVTDNGNTDNAILDFIDANGIDWLVMMPRKHSFFDSIIHKSHTRALVHHSHLPILAIHEHKNQ